MQSELKGIRIKLVDLKLVKDDVPLEKNNSSQSDASIQIHYAMVNIKTKEIIGCIKLDKIKDLRNTYNISYFVLEKHRGHAYTKKV